MSASPPVAELSSPVHCLRGVGPKRRVELEKVGVRTVEDLLLRLPLRYEDRSSVRPVATLRDGEKALVRGKVIAAEVRPTRRPRFSIFYALVADDSGRLPVLWFNQPYLADQVKPGYSISLFGPVTTGRSGRGLEMANPHFETGGKARGETGVVPIYERIGSVGGRAIRSMIRDLLTHYRIELPAAAPATLLERLGLMTPTEALRAVHLPQPGADVQALNDGRAPEQRSLIFDEFFGLQVGLAMRRQARGAEAKPLVIRTSPAVRKTLRDMLPFRLTAGQRQALKEIVDDMTGPCPMRRLVQGDVGCGKTIVALLAAALAMENGCQVAFMAPTEILAEQHIEVVRRHLSHTSYRVELLTGSLSQARKNEVQAGLESGSIDLVVGTHALIQDEVSFCRLGLVIIDEQHRFGVLQRGRLAAAGRPDVLIMTATPIPRSLTLTLFGDLETSIIRDMPPGRKDAVTAVRPYASLGRIVPFVRRQMDAGRQVYAVAPAVEKGQGELDSARDVRESMLRAFPGRSVELLHGRLPPAQLADVMARFAAGGIDLLACTTVIEVGVDVPNATVMLVFGADRFGLAQLHQLRGRVGRGEHKSYCILLHDPACSPQALERLQILESAGDGFEIAERDLELRGPGDFFGTRQSGLPQLRCANLARDTDELMSARREAFSLVLGGKSAPGKEAERSHAVDHARRYWRRRFGLVLIG